MRRNDPRLLLGALVLGPLVLSAVYVWILKSAPTEDGASASRGGRSGAPAAPAEVPDEGPEGAAELVDGSSADTGEREEVAEAPAPEEVAVEPLTGPVLRGRVQLPEGTPADERALVLVADEHQRFGQLYDDDGLVELAWLRYEDPLHPTPGVLSLAPVDADGGFEVALPEGAEDAHLAVAGRFLLSRETTHVRVDDDAEVVLAAELGGLVHGAVYGRNGMPLAGVPVDIGPDIGRGFRPMEASATLAKRSVRTGADGAFEFGGVPSGATWMLLAQPQALAPTVERAVEVDAARSTSVELTCVRGATVRGRVVDEDGAGVAEAGIELRFRGVVGQVLEGLDEVEADEQGHFELTAVPAGDVVLEVNADGYLGTEHALAESLGDGDVLTDVEVVLDGGLAIAGRVVFPDGTPAAGSSVQARPDIGGTMGPGMGAFARNPPASGSADEEGRFELAPVGEGAYEVRARFETEPTSEEEAAEDWSAFVPGVAAGADDVLVTLEPLASLVGHVTDDEGTPVEEFRAVAERVGSGGTFGIGAERVQARGEEEAPGAFTLRGLREASWNVTVVAEGFASSGPLEVEMPRAPDAGDLHVTLQRSSSIAGVVLDTNDRPVAGARVVLELDLQAMIESMGRSGGPPSVYTAADGTFLLEGMDPGSLAVRAEMDGFAASEAVAVEVESGERAEDVVLRLRVGGSVAGVVLGPDGEPQSGRMVMLQSMPGFTQQHFATSDGEGEFRVEHVAPGSYQVIATNNFMEEGMEGGSDAEAMERFIGNMEIEFAQVVDEEETWVVLGAAPEDPVSLTIQVLHDGAPVEGAVVVLMPGDGEGPASFGMKFTDAEGRLETELEHPGEWLITVQGQVVMGQQNAIEFLETVPDGAEAHEVELDLPTGRISGTVRGPDGEPVGGARVTLNVEGGNTFGSFLGGRYAEVTTEADGTYDLPWLRSGTYTVSAGGTPMGGMLGGDAAHGRELRAGIGVAEGAWVAGVDFELDAPGAVAGVVRDAGGAPVADATVFVRDERGAILERFSLSTTDAGGRFRYSGLAPGSYSVEARAENAAGESAAVRVEAGATAQADVTLDLGTMLLVTVVDASDADVAARVSVRDEAGREHNGLMSMEAILSAFGQGYSSSVQRVGPVPPGRYLVSAITDDGRDTVKPVVVSGQPERKVKLRLK